MMKQIVVNNEVITSEDLIGIANTFEWFANTMRTNTDLIKSAVEAGNLEKAYNLYFEMCAVLDEIGQQITITEYDDEIHS